MNIDTFLLTLILLPFAIAAEYPPQSPVGRHGTLQVKGTFLCNEQGDTIQLRGVGTHGIQWYGEFLHEKSMKLFAEEWKADVIRVSMYTAPEADGYIKNPHLKEKVIEIVTLAEKYGLYCIIDWHHLTDNDPNIYKKEAKLFFQEMVTHFKDKKHVLYEICNEPDDQVSWEWDIKPYATELIPLIQDVNPAAIVIVGTPHWCQDLITVADSPLEGKNIMYSIHFYAGEHGYWVQYDFTNAVTRIPLIATEFGTTMSDGDRGVYINRTNYWLHLLHENKVSWVNWSLSNKNEDCAILKEGTPAEATWSDDDLTRSGKYVKDRLINGHSNGPYTITVPPIAHGRVAITPQKAQYHFGEEIEVEAIPDEGYTFHSWHGFTENINPQTITVHGDFDFWPEIIHGSEKIVNGDFSLGQQYWKFISWGTSSAEAAVVKGEMVVTIDEAGKDPWDIQLEQRNLTIEEGKTYKLRFTASAEKERYISVDVGMSAEPWESYSTFKKITIGPEPQIIERFFQMKKSTDTNGRLYFDLGKESLADVKLSNVSLIDTVLTTAQTLAHPVTQQEVTIQQKGTVVRVLRPDITNDAFLTLISLQGKVLYRTPFTGTSVVINSNALALSKGIYFLKVINGNKVQYHTLQL